MLSSFATSVIKILRTTNTMCSQPSWRFRWYPFSTSYPPWFLVIFLFLVSSLPDLNMIICISFPFVSILFKIFSLFTCSLYGILIIPLWTTFRVFSKSVMKTFGIPPPYNGMILSNRSRFRSLCKFRYL